MKQVVLIGAGGHAHAVWDAILSKSSCEVIACSHDGNPSFPSQNSPKIKTIYESDLADFLSANPTATCLAAVGPFPREKRTRVLEVLEETQRRAQAIVHKSAYISPTACVGHGSVIMGNSFVGPGVVIGRDCVVNTGAAIDHDVRTGDNVFVGPGANIGGLVDLGNHSVICIGSSIQDGMAIGEEAIIGGGAFVRDDVGPKTRVGGVPAKTF